MDSGGLRHSMTLTILYENTHNESTIYSLSLNENKIKNKHQHIDLIFSEITWIFKFRLVIVKTIALFLQSLTGTLLAQKQ